MPIGNVADLVICAVIAVSVAVGLWRGFIGEVLSLVCWVAAFWIAWAFGAAVAQFYSRWVESANVAQVAGYVTCFAGVLVVGALLGWAARKLVSRGGLGFDDRLLGMGFGLARGLVLVTFATLVLGFTAVPRHAEWWRHSLLLPVFEHAAGWFASQAPEPLGRYLDAGADRVSTGG